MKRSRRNRRSRLGGQTVQMEGHTSVTQEWGPLRKEQRQACAGGRGVPGGDTEGLGRLATFFPSPATAQSQFPCRLL